MILHTVHFWLNKEVSEDQKREFIEGIRTFALAVDEIKSFEIGVPAGTPEREVVDNSFQVSLFVHFGNVEDHNIYQSHPAHDVFVNRFNDLWAKVVVRDSSLMSD